MQISTLGSLVGLALQLCAGAALVIWPDTQLVARLIFGLGLAIFVASFAWWLASRYQVRWPLVRRGGSPATKVSPEEQEGVPPLTSETEETKEKRVDPQIYNGLMDFTVEHLLPTCDILVALNRKMIFKTFRNKTIRALIDVGFWQYDRSRFLSAVNGIKNEISESQRIDYDILLARIRDIVNSYGSVISLHNEMEKNCDFVFMRDFPSEWEDWRNRHHAMVAAYEPLRKRSEIPELYSPGKPPHWGDVP